MSASSHENDSSSEGVDDLDNIVHNYEVREDNEAQQQYVEQEPAEQQTNQDSEAEEAPARKEAKPKRVIRNPQPKLNVDTLKGPRGLHILPKVFENVKFKGRGHEEQDLNLLMKNYEYWCHRLFPKFAFDDCLARIEKLGYKKTVETHIKKIRMDLLMDEETAQLESDKEEAEVVDQFDEVAPSLDTPIQLTEEQLERIRLNKERALKRLQELKNAAANTQTSSQQESADIEEETNRTSLNDSSQNEKIDTGLENQTTSVDNGYKLENSPNQKSTVEANGLQASSSCVDESENQQESAESTMDGNVSDVEQEHELLEADVQMELNSHQGEENQMEEEMDIESMLDVIATGP